MLKDPDWTVRCGLVVEEEADFDDTENAGSDESISEQSVNLIANVNSSWTSYCRSR